MKIELTALEARVVGCLVEKEITTPDQYPLSLNALVLACNQKTNREPVLELADAAVQDTVDALVRRHLVSDKSGAFGGRVTKYKHRFCNTEFGALKFSPQELGILCVMLLRGPQTPGELRQRTNRLCEFSDVDEVEATLEKLMTRDDGPFVARLARAPGSREHRYAHLFSGEIESVAATVHEAQAHEPGLGARVAMLESEVDGLKKELADLKAALGMTTTESP
ncbi:MAG: DUF480 domain-containing protein [Gammaproteobacteria bacterium]|nr:DUF480 domain-containing protein [Gammaproteobacteria bacterium]